MADRSQLYNDPEEAMRLAQRGLQANIWTSMPGIVTDVDLTKMTCSVQPSIQGIVEDENGRKQSVNLPLLVDCPIVFPRAGNFIITFPVAPGDEVLVSFASRCIDAWWQSGGIQRPMEARMHDLSDGFAIPGPSSQPKKVSGISSTSLQIRNLAGTTYMEIDAAGKIKLVAPAEIDITAPLVKVTGNLDVTGNIVATGSIAGPGGVDMVTHKHGGVTTGPGNTGTPIP